MQNSQFKNVIRNYTINNYQQVVALVHYYEVNGTKFTLFLKSYYT